MRDGRHDFDFFFGSWQQENRKRVKPLVRDDEWVEFESFSEARPILGGLGSGDGHLDPPVLGRFDDGIGVFECDDELEGVPLKVRFTWKDITSVSAVWEQSFSFDDGATWDANWTTRHARVA
jgi:hypothetical protein